MSTIDQRHRAASYLRDLASLLDDLAASAEPARLDDLTSEVDFAWGTPAREMHDVAHLDERWAPAAERVTRRAAGAAWLRELAGAIVVERAESTEAAA